MSLVPDNALSRAPIGGEKVAIPRLQRPGQALVTSKKRQRVQQACTSCRSLKLRCPGDVPTCKRCQNTDRRCLYILPRRDKLKVVTERCVQMAALLKMVRNSAGEDHSVRIDELLDGFRDEMTNIPQVHERRSLLADTDDADTGEPINLLDESIRKLGENVNTELLDLVNEDLHHEGRTIATGFIGQSSEVQWFRTLLQQEQPHENLVRAEIAERKDADNTTTTIHRVRDMTFYLDGVGADLDSYVEQYRLPMEETAKQLLSIYMDKVHDSFSILTRTTFEDRFHRYFRAIRAGTAPRPNAKWQAILNLVFAIGARHSHFAKSTGQPDQRDQRDHRVYQARARLCGWDESAFIQHPDQNQVQLGGLLAFYYASVGQVSRAWNVVGVALRHAQALGFHLRNEDPSTSDSKRQAMVHIWWALYTLDRQLCIITGRPSAIIDSYCSVPLPDAFSEERLANSVNPGTWTRQQDILPTFEKPVRSKSMTFVSGPMHSVEPFQPSHNFNSTQTSSCSLFKAIIQIDIIVQIILSSLYSATTMTRPQGELQQNILQLIQRLDNWLTILPTDLNFQVRHSGVNPPTQNFIRQRTLLGFKFHEARILLTRPCLAGFGPTQEGEQRATTAAAFMTQMANVCVEAAKMKLDLLPDQQNPLFVYEFGPWWSIVHHLMQALAVLLLALSSTSISQDRIAIMSYAKKAIRWLRALDDPLATQAYERGFEYVIMIARRLSLDISDLWEEHVLGPSRTASSVSEREDIDPSPASMIPVGEYGQIGHSFGPIISTPLSDSAIPSSYLVDPSTLFPIPGYTCP